MTDDRSQGLLAWQLGLYPAAHTLRATLALHLVAVPLFQLGTVALLAGPFVNLWLSLAGAAAITLAFALEGYGHKLEPQAPVPFRSPFDFLLRFFVEQWITYPRFVLGGGFARAWSRPAGRPE